MNSLIPLKERDEQSHDVGFWMKDNDYDYTFVEERGFKFKVKTPFVKEIIK